MRHSNRRRGMSAGAFMGMGFGDYRPIAPKPKPGPHPAQSSSDVARADRDSGASTGEALTGRQAGATGEES